MWLILCSSSNRVVTGSVLGVVLSAGDCAESWRQAGEYGSTSSLGVHRLVEQADTHKM